MAHNGNDSLSASSISSLETYESLKDEILVIEQSKVDLQQLTDVATKIINKFATNPPNTYKHNENFVKLDAVMTSMLVCAEDCGGEAGQRYVASVIVACSRKGDDEDVVQTLAAVATTWLTHLLFPFKASSSHSDQLNKEPNELATPTLSETASYVGGGVPESRGGSFADDVLKRDGHKCVVMGWQGRSHPTPDPNLPMHFLEAAHILRRAVGKFNSNHASESFKSAVASFDILVSFTRLSVEKLQDLESHIDSPSNGMMLGMEAHKAFDNFYWCLKKTETENVYAVKIFENVGIYDAPAFVTFKDHSEQFDLPHTRKRHRPIDLPDPDYIRIHGAIAGILNMSGAGKFFDELLDKYKDDEGKVPPVRSWPELEKLLEEEQLREAVAESLKSVRVY